MSARDDLGRTGPVAEIEMETEPELERREAPVPRPPLGERAPLFENPEAEELRSRWESVQASFVDEPRRSVEEADGLVKDLLERLESRFSGERERLEQEWAAGEQASTEDLRMALQHYRSFFERLLSI